ncbi:hypothetical protein, partial [Bartonella capreoli]|uniref:hypothetical protein n=1 Tax=Bartonella capreoli TaxID=155192 RepID=UPI001ABC9CAA
MKFEGGCGRWLGGGEVGLGGLSSRGIFKSIRGGVVRTGGVGKGGCRLGWGEEDGVWGGVPCA